MTDREISACAFGVIVGAFATLFAMGAAQSVRAPRADDGVEHAVFVRACVERRPLRECHADACVLWPKARACSGGKR